MGTSTRSRCALNNEVVYAVRVGVACGSAVVQYEVKEHPAVHDWNWFSWDIPATCGHLLRKCHCRQWWCHCCASHHDWKHSDGLDVSVPHSGIRWFNNSVVDILKQLPQIEGQGFH